MGWEECSIVIGEVWYRYMRCSGVLELAERRMRFDVKFWSLFIAISSMHSMDRND